MKTFFDNSKGDWLWLEPEKSGEFAVAVGARVINADSNKLVLITDEKRVQTLTLKYNITYSH